MKNNIEMQIECPACDGTGVYVGMGERKGAAVVCKQCKGTGSYQYKFSYNQFNGIKKRDDVKRVYKSGYGYVIAPEKLNFKVGDSEVEVDMSKEGVNYTDFVDGDMPEHVESMVCPLLADQGACHKITGFVDKCTEINGGWIGQIASCKNQCNKADCWKRFNGN